MLADRQLARLTTLFQHGSDDASLALSKWLGRPSRISVEQVEQVPLADATEVLGDPEKPVCFCAMTLHGQVTGQLILAFDDASGLGLADLLLERPIGTSTAWGDVEQSAALETANIIGCAYLNSLAKCFSEAAPQSLDQSHELVPSPPQFARDFAESLLQFALMNQAMASDLIFLTRTEFRIENAPVNCNLLFVPDADCLNTLRGLLPA
ncbi:MAG: chemotaxis protein CheC [Planctomycetales bacterium]